MKLGKAMEIRMRMMAMTIRSSIRVKPTILLGAARNDMLNKPPRKRLECFFYLVYIVVGRVDGVKMPFENSERKLGVSAKSIDFRSLSAG
jgi:hypothetical protein